MIDIVKYSDPSVLSEIRKMFLAYQKELGLDLCFQGFTEELENLPGKYNDPEGCLLMAINEEKEIVGVVALKALDKTTCEMKRLYVKDEYRKYKTGFKLIEAIISSAKEKGYEKMKLDTLSKLKPAIRLYQFFEFKETKPYNYNPDNTVLYFEKELF